MRALTPIAFAARVTRFVSSMGIVASSQVVRSTPQKIIAENTDWRFLNELKEELKT